MSEPDALKFAYWVPNVSGGLVVSKIEQRTDWSYDYNRQLAVLAENNGFEYALTQVRYIASYGAAYQHESTSISLAIALATERLKVIAAIHPGLWQPGVLAKLVASADVMTEGRMAINVVSGWFKDEFHKRYSESAKEIGRFNLAVFGKTGVGKSTLVNAVFGAEVAKTGIGEPAERDRVFPPDATALDHTPAGSSQRGVDMFGSGFGFVHLRLMGESQNR